MKVSLIRRLENHARLRPTEWISGMDYGLLAYKQGYKPDTASRRLRELAHPKWLLEKHPEKKNCRGCSDGILAHRETGNYVEYKWRGEEKKEWETDLDKKLAGMWCDLCGTNHPGDCEKIWQKEEKSEVPSVAGMGRLFG